MAALVPSTSAAARARVDALARVQALEALGHAEPARRLLHELLPVLRTDGPADLLPESEYLYGRLLRRTGRADEAGDALVRAEQLAEGAWRDDLLVAVSLDLARLSLDDRVTLTAKERQAQRRRGEREYGRASAIFVRDGGDPESDRDFLEVAALLAMRAGEKDSAMHLRDRALRGGSGPHDAALDAQFLGQLANRIAASGELDAAIDVDGEAVDRALHELGETHHVTVVVAFNAAGRLLRRGSLDAGQRALDRVLQAASGPQGRAEYAAGSLLLYAGESELAWPYAERAAAIARQREDALQLAHAFHLQAEILLRRGDHEAAHRAAEAAIAAIPTSMPAPDALLLRQQLEVHRAETLIYVRRGGEALEQVRRLRRELAATGEPVIDDLSARLRLAEAQALTLLGRFEAAFSALSPGSAHAQLCDRLSDRLKVGDVHPASLPR